MVIGFGFRGKTGEIFLLSVRLKFKLSSMVDYWAANPAGIYLSAGNSLTLVIQQFSPETESGQSYARNAW